MATNCTRCEGTGFLNIDQAPPEIAAAGVEAVENWMIEQNRTREASGGCSCHLNPPCAYCLADHDVQVCDCCGDGDTWYGTPGEHYSNDDPSGPNGPYAYNGGLCECH